MTENDPESAFRAIFRRAHADHHRCSDDEWLHEPCRDADGSPAERPLVWSRRNGPWQPSDVLWVGAAPGNAGGMGGGEMGAHGTRIPFGGDIAGANLDILLSSVGLDRNSTYIVASLNQLPDRGGGEPRVAELLRPVGDYPTSLHLLRDTLLAVRPRLVVLLGNVALRTTVAATRLELKSRLTLTGLARLRTAGLRRGGSHVWPDAFPPDDAFLAAWNEGGEAPLPRLLWLLHPSAQNMSPHAGADTVFHTRMLETLDALRDAVADLPGGGTPEAVPSRRGTPPPPWPAEGIYALPEWRDAIGPRHAELMGLWRDKGV